MIETKGAELNVTAASPNSTNSGRSALGKLCIGSGTSKLKFPLLTDLNTLSSGCSVFVSAITTDTHIGNCNWTLKPIIGDTTQP